jgi:hypothetical protein
MSHALDNPASTTSDAGIAKGDKRARTLGHGVYQTDFTASKGNALQACIATVLGLTLDEVPNFIAMPGDLYDNLREYLAKKHGLGFFKIMLDDEGRLPFAPGALEMICLVAGDSPRGSHRHVVVARVPPSSLTPEFVFDPHPSGDMIRSKSWAGLFVVSPPL